MHEKIRKQQDRKSWKIRFSDGTVGICYGTYGGTVEIAELKKEFYGGDFAVEGEMTTMQILKEKLQSLEERKKGIEIQWSNLDPGRRREAQMEMWILEKQCQSLKRRIANFERKGKRSKGELK